MTINKGLKIRFFLNIVFLTMSLLVLAGCSSTQGEGGRKPGYSFDPVPFKTSAFPFIATYTQGKPPEELMSRVRGKTVLTFSIGHGTQVEYMGANGTSYLWYGSNERSLRGTYYVEERGRRRYICWVYGPNAYNPITKQSGDQADCSDLDGWLRRIKEIADGDVFDLASGAVPFKGVGLQQSFMFIWNKVQNSRP